MSRTTAEERKNRLDRIDEYIYICRRDGEPKGNAFQFDRDLIMDYADLEKQVEEKEATLEALNQAHIHLQDKYDRVCNHRNILIEQVDELQRDTEWQPIETAPRDGSLVLLAVDLWELDDAPAMAGHMKLQA